MAPKDKSPLGPKGFRGSEPATPRHTPHAPPPAPAEPASQVDLQRFAGQKCTGADCAGLRACVFWPGFAGADFTKFMQQAVACHPEDQAISAVVQLAYERRARSLVPLAFGWF